MRTLWTRFVMPAALLASLAVAGAARAESISARWISGPPGSEGLGTSNLTVGPGNAGAEVVLEVTVDPGASGASAVGVVFQYDPQLLGAASEARCPAAAGNEAAGSCGTDPTGLLSTNSDAVNAPGMIGGIQTGGPPPAGQNTPFTFSHLTFTIQSGSGTTGNLAYRPGLDGVVTTASEMTYPPLGPASITLPEPGGIGLLAGLGALALGSRWRQPRR